MQAAIQSLIAPCCAKRSLHTVRTGCCVCEWDTCCMTQSCGEEHSGSARYMCVNGGRNAKGAKGMHGSDRGCPRLAARAGPLCYLFAGVAPLIAPHFASPPERVIRAVQATQHLPLWRVGACMYRFAASHPKSQRPVKATWSSVLISTRRHHKSVVPPGLPAHQTAAMLSAICYANRGDGSTRGVLSCVSPSSAWGAPNLEMGLPLVEEVEKACMHETFARACMDRW